MKIRDIFIVRGGAEKSLARPTSQCRRTESIVSLERRVCSCAELQDFACYRGWKEAYQATRPISTTSRHGFFFAPAARQGAEGNSRHSDRNVRGTCTIVCHREKWVAQFKSGDFSNCVAPCPERPKTVTTPEIIDQIHELILEDCWISAKSIDEQLGISRERVGSIHEDWTCGSSPRSGSRNAWTGIKNVNGASRLSNFRNFFPARSKWFLFGRDWWPRTKPWLYHYDPETKQQSMEWRHSGSTRPKKFRVQKSAGKVLASILWDQDGIFLIDYLP